MNTEEGKIWYSVNLDTSTLKKDAAKASSIFREIRNSAETEGSGIGSIFRKVGKEIGAYFTVDAVKSFGLQLIEITGQFQKYEAVLSNTLQSPVKAQAAMSMLKEFATTTPFQVDALTESFVKLANMGFIPTYEQMTKLGDLASSTGKGFDQLAEAIIDAQSGEFESLKEFGIMASKEGDKVTFMFREQATQVNFNASSIRDYILSLGDIEGVMGTNAKIAETLSGQYSNLENAVTQMMNEIGQSSEGALSGAIEGASYLVDNYEKIGKILISLITTYGAYQAALMFASAISKEYTITQLVQRKTLLITDKAQKILNATMLSNPLVLMMTLIVGVVSALWAFNDGTTAAEQAQERFNERLEDGKKKQDKFISKTNELIGVIREETNTRYLQTKAFKELQEMYPDLFKSMSMEELLLMDNLELQKLINEEIDKQKNKDFSAGLTQAQTKYDKAKSEYEAALNSYNSGNANWGTSIRLVTLEFDLYEAKKSLKLYSDEIEKQREIMADAQPINVKIADLSQNIELLKSQLIKFQLLQEEAKKNNPLGWTLYDGLIDGLVTKIAENENDLSKLNITSTISTTYGVDYKAAQEEWETAKKELTEIEKDKNAFTRAQYESAKKRHDEAKSAFDNLGGNIDTKSPQKNNQAEESARQKEEAQKAEEELRSLLVDMRHDTTQSVIDADDDGAWKELAQIQLNYDKKQVAIERWEKEQRNAVIEAQKKKYIGEHGSDKGFVVNNSAPEFATITASVEAQTALNKKVQSDALDANSKSEKDAMNDYLAAWGNMEEKRAAITAQYAEKRRNAKTKGENLSLDKEEEKSISDLEVENLLGSAYAKTLFGDLDNLSSKTIQTIAASLRVKAKEKFKDGTLGEQEYLDMLKRIGDVEKQAQSNNPFAMLARSAKDAFSKIDKDDEDSTNKRKASWREFGVAMGGSLDLAAQAMQEVGNIADTLGVSEETKATISQVTGMLSGAGDLAKGVATGDVSSIIKGAGSMITSMINLFDFRTKRANKIIKEEAVNIEETKKKYKDLERTVKGALGTDYYQKQIDGAKLLQDQISSIDKQIAAEESKRKGKRNNDQIDAWKEEQKELTEQIKETKQKVVDELSTTDLKSYSMDLSSSIIDGLASGLDNANEVIDEKMDTLLKNMIAKQFDMLVAQEQMKPMFEAMADGFGEKSEGGFALTDSELKKIVEKGNQGKAGIISSLDDYEKILEEFGLVNEDITDKANSAAGAISAELTEQTGSELLGMQRLQSDTLLQLKEINNYGFSFIRESWSDISNLAAATLQIEANTYRAANNTDSLSDGLKVIGDRLEKIEKNTTKSYTK